MRVNAIAPGVNMTSDRPRREAERVPVDRKNNHTAIAAVEPEMKVAAMALVGQLKPVTA
jgi:hypothetical protein